MKKSEKLLSDFASGKLYETEEDKRIKNEILRRALEDFKDKEELTKERFEFTNKFIKKKNKKRKTC